MVPNAGTSHPRQEGTDHRARHGQRPQLSQPEDMSQLAPRRATCTAQGPSAALPALAVPLKEDYRGTVVQAGPPLASRPATEHGTGRPCQVTRSHQVTRAAAHWASVTSDPTQKSFLYLPWGRLGRGLEALEGVSPCNIPNPTPPRPSRLGPTVWTPALGWTGAPSTRFPGLRATFSSGQTKRHTGS